jgi:hypothetical protein
MPSSTPTPAPENWVSICRHFEESAFIDTELRILAQNAGLSWYYKGHDETPRKYIAYAFDELNSVPGLVGKKSRIRRLFDILESTIAFDAPFAEMAEGIKTDIDIDADPNRILSRLGIDPNFPAGLIQFDAASKALLFDKSLQTLDHLLAFVDHHADQITLPVDCKALLNCLVHRDEIGISRYLPFRVGVKGLHLAESIGLIARDIPEAMQYALLQRAGVELNQAEKQTTATIATEVFEEILLAASARIAVACSWFKEESSILRNKTSSVADTERFFVPLNHPHRERVAAVLARIHYGVDPSLGKHSMFASILKVFHRS